MSWENYTILGLDLGNTLGWSLCKGGVIVQSGVVNLKPKDSADGTQFIIFQDDILSKFTKVDEICYEKVTFASTLAQAGVYMGLLAHLKAHCIRHRIKYYGFPNQTLKLQFAGTGNANKHQMCARAHELGWKHGELGTDLDNDECDAIASIFVRLSMIGKDCRFK